MLREMKSVLGFTVMRTVLILAGLVLSNVSNAAISDLNSFCTTCIDLTDPGTSSGYIDGTSPDDGSGLGLFEVLAVQPAGTGKINSFLRIQRTGTNGSTLSSQNQGMEQGYNTGGLTEFDTKEIPGPGGSDFTRAIQLGEIPVVDIDGTLYREFKLDINEPNGQKTLLSLDELRLFTDAGSTLAGYNTGTGQLGGKNAVWDMDANSDVDLILDYSNSSGSGESDLVFYVESDVFGADESQFVYMYNKFGDTYITGLNEQGKETVLLDARASDGFEEWWHEDATARPPGEVPAPPIVWLVGAGLVGILATRRRRVSWFAR